MDTEEQQQSTPGQLGAEGDLPSETQGTAPATGRRVVQLPSNAIAAIRQEERERGRRTAQQELETEARRLGFSSLAEMREAAAAARRGNERQRVEEAASAGEDAAAPKRRRSNPEERYKEEIARLKEQQRRTNRARARSDRQLRTMQRQVEAQQAEHQLRLAAVQAGVRDVDYAMHLLRRQLAGKSVTELQSFDESRWFREDLRRVAPYVFDARVEPATTGTGGGAAEEPSAPPVPREGKKPEAPKNGGTGKGLTNAMAMSREEYMAYLRSKGLNDPNSGV